jgi:hypothetical protein
MLQRKPPIGISDPTQQLCHYWQHADSTGSCLSFKARYTHRPSSSAWLFVGVRLGSCAADALAAAGSSPTIVQPPGAPQQSDKDSNSYHSSVYIYIILNHGCHCVSYRTSVRQSSLPSCPGHPSHPKHCHKRFQLHMCPNMYLYRVYLTRRGACT